jgi:hypothetical protein
MLLFYIIYELTAVRTKNAQIIFCASSFRNSLDVKFIPHYPEVDWLKRKC